MAKASARRRPPQAAQEAAVLGPAPSAPAEPQSPTVARLWPAATVESWPIGKLLPYARNARLHSDEQLGLLCASIREFGWTVPVLVDEAGVLIAGHGRVMAAQRLGITSVPTMVARGWTEEQKRAYRIADNKLPMLATWDDRLLGAEFAALRDISFDLGPTGFAPIEIDRLLAGMTDPKDGDTDEDDAPPVQGRPVVRAGEVWCLGDHRLLCGDATRFADVDRCLGGVLADMTFTDPPYRVAYVGKGSSAENRRTIENDNLSKDDFAVFMLESMKAILTATRGAVYVAMSSGELHTLRAAFEAAGGHWSTYVIWVKNVFTLGRSDYQRQYEPILYGWREGEKHFWCGARDQGDAWFAKKPRTNDLHPTMKPVELMERAIQNSCPDRGVVLDPFAGSGSTLIAADKLGRRARVIELDPLFCDVIIRRWQAFRSGSVATLEGDGRTFGDVERERLA